MLMNETRGKTRSRAQRAAWDLTGSNYLLFF
jgi:hypothetical protein